MSATAITKRNILYIYLNSLFGNGYFERAIFILYLTGKGYTLLQVGFLQSLVNLTMFVCEIPTGMFADRFGRKTSLILGRLLIILYFVGLIYADSYVCAAGAFVALGLGVTFISGSEEALLFDSSKELGQEKEFTRIAGRYSAIITLVLALATGVGGYLKDISWTSVFLVSIGFQVLGLLFTFGIQEVKSQKEQSAANNPAFTQFIKDTASFLRLNGAFRALVIGIAVFSGMISIYLIFVQQLLSEGGYSAAEISTVSAVSSLLAAFASDRVHLLEARFTQKSVMLVTVVLAGVLFLLIYPEISWLAVTAFVLIRLSLYFFSPVSYTLINMEIPSEQRATLLSVMNFFSSLFMFVLAPVIGYMADKFGAQKFLAVAGAVSMLLVWICLVYFFKSKQVNTNVGNVEENSLKGLTE